MLRRWHQPLVGFEIFTDVHVVDRSPLFRRPLRPLRPIWGLLGSLGLEGSPLQGAPINPLRVRTEQSHVDAPAVFRPSPCMGLELPTGDVYVG